MNTTTTVNWHLGGRYNAVMQTAWGFQATSPRAAKDFLRCEFGDLPKQDNKDSVQINRFTVLNQGGGIFAIKPVVPVYLTNGYEDVIVVYFFASDDEAVEKLNDYNDSARMTWPSKMMPDGTVTIVS